MADIIPFRSRFDIDCESAIAVALFGPDGGRSRTEARRRKLGLARQPEYPAGFELDVSSPVDCSHMLGPIDDKPEKP